MLLLGFAPTCVCLGRAATGIRTHVHASRLCCYRDLHSRKICAQWSPGPRRPPIVICAQSATARACWRWRCARSGRRCHRGSQGVDGAAVPICSQGVVPCHVGARHVLSCHVASCHVTSRRVASCHLSSCHVAMLCRVMSCHVLSCVSCHVMSRHVMPCHVVSCRVLSCRFASCYVAKSGHNTLAHLPHSYTTQTHAAHTQQLIFIFHSRSHSLHSRHSHSCARVVLSTSHSFRFRLPTNVFFFQMWGYPVLLYKRTENKVSRV